MPRKPKASDLQTQQHEDAVARPTPVIPAIETLHLGKVRRMTRERQALYLATLAETGNHTIASKRCGLSRYGCQEFRSRNPEFEKLCDAALEEYADALENIVDDWAFGPDLKRRNALLAMFRLKALRPERYQEKGTNVTVGVGINLNES